MRTLVAMTALLTLVTGCSVFVSDNDETDLYHPDQRTCQIQAGSLGPLVLKDAAAVCAEVPGRGWRSWGLAYQG